MQTNGVTQGAPPRTKMPQTDAFETSTNVINKLVKGSINFVNPETNLKESTIYNKKNMKKVLITESQLRGMVRKMLNEMDGMSIPVGGGQGFGTPPGVKSKPPLSTPPGVKSKPPIITPQQMQQRTQQKDQPIETAMITALQKDTALMGKLKGVTNFSQADSLIKAVLGLTKIPQAQIKTGLATLLRMGVQTQAPG
jgi:hypothetical protein